MYEALADFLNRDTWHTGHKNDIGVFAQALHKIIHKPEFNADEMGDYIRKQKNMPIDTRDHPLDGAVQGLVGRAWAIREYFDSVPPVGDMTSGQIRR